MSLKDEARRLAKANVKAKMMEDNPELKQGWVSLTEQAKFNRGIIDVLASITANLDLATNVGDNTWNRVFAEIDEVSKIIGYDRHKED